MCYRLRLHEHVTVLHKPCPKVQKYILRSAKSREGCKKSKISVTSPGMMTGEREMHLAIFERHIVKRGDSFEFNDICFSAAEAL